MMTLYNMTTANNENQLYLFVCYMTQSKNENSTRTETLPMLEQCLEYSTLPINKYHSFNINKETFFTPHVLITIFENN